MHETESFAVHINTNKDGMRDDPVGPKTKPRIAVLGDSIAWGWGVEHGQRFDTLLEKSMGIEMLNFSVVGYNPLQYYLQLDKILSYKPDAVLVVFVLANDFSSAVNIESETYHPYAEYRNKKFSIKGYPIPDYRKYNLFRGREHLTINSYALGRLFYFTLKLQYPDLFKALFGVPDNHPAIRGVNPYDRDMIYRHPTSWRVDRAVKVNHEILKRMRDKLRSHGVPLLVMATVIKKHKEKAHIPHRLLENSIKKLQIPFIPMDRRYRATDALYQPYDNHWNAQGHKLAKELIQPHLQRLMKDIHPKRP
jgi:hypothetical protein